MTSKYIIGFCYTNQELEICEQKKYVYVKGGNINLKLDLITDVKYTIHKEKENDKDSKKYSINVSIKKMCENKKMEKLLKLIHTTKLNLYEKSIFEKCFTNNTNIFNKQSINIIESKINKYFYYENNYININNKTYDISTYKETLPIIVEFNFNGGIIIDNKNTWKEIFDVNTTLLLNITGIDNTFSCKSFNNINNKTDYERIVIDLTIIELTYDKIINIFNNCKSIKAKYKWIILNKPPIFIKDMIEIINFISNRVIQYPVYEKHNVEYFFDDIIFIIKNKEQSPNINNIKINRIKCFKSQLELSINNNILESSIPIFYNIYNSKEESKVLPCSICSICMEKINNNRCITKCNHHYCINCIGQHLLNKKDCPLCRRVLISSSLYISNNNSYSKFDKIIDILKNNSKNNIIIFKNIKLAKLLNNILIKNQLQTILLNGDINKKALIIDSINKNGLDIIICLCTDDNFIKTIMGIRRIFILENNYDFILNKNLMGSDYLEKKEKIEINILEF